MKFLRLLFALVLLLQSLFAQANSIENPLSCSLPAPAWITATNITSSSISVEWADVSGASGYRVSRYDVTHGIPLPDVDVVESEYTSSPHDPGTTISFEVRAICENHDLGSPITGEYTTNIIVVDVIANFTAPTTPAGDYPIPANSNSNPFTFTDAPVSASTVSVLRLKISYTDQSVGTAFAEVLMWSQCTSPENASSRVKYFAASTSPAVTHTEVHSTGGAPVTSIVFRYGTNHQPFFTIFPSATTFTENEPATGSFIIHNDRPVVLGVDNTIHAARSYNTELNPCDPPMHMQDAGGHAHTDPSSSDDKAVQDYVDQAIIMSTSSTAALKVNPNPFSNGFKVDYTLDEESPVSFDLFDYTGREIRTMNLPSLAAGQYSTGISTDDLPVGIYLLAFQTNRGRTVTTLVKH